MGSTPARVQVIAQPLTQQRRLTFLFKHEAQLHETPRKRKQAYNENRSTYAVEAALAAAPA